MGSVTNKLSDIANDSMDVAKNLVHGHIGDAFRSAFDASDNAVPGGTILRRFGENHPGEAIALVATIVTAGAASPSLTAAEGAEVAGTAATAESAGAADAYMTGGMAGTAASTTPVATAGAAELGSAADAYMTGGVDGTLANTAAQGGTVAPAATEVASSAPGTAEAANAAFGPGASTVAPPAADEGMISNILNWAKNNKELASSMITGAGMTIGSAAKGALDYASAENKAQLDRETLLEVAKQKPALYQQFVRASSAGGGGVALPFGAPAQQKPLTNASGQPIFGQGGIIGSRLGGG